MGKSIEDKDTDTLCHHMYFYINLLFRSESAKSQTR